jgi:hypothetical protein
MRVQVIPVFRDLHILRKSMLEALADYAFLADQLLHKDYGDGILAGCELTTTEDSILLREGVFFYEGQLFLIKEPMAVTYHPTNTTTVLKVRFSEERTDGNFIYREIDLFLTEQTELRKGELELCRFKLQEGAVLRYWYQNFEDRNTEFDTLNTIHAAYSVKGGTTLSPEILREFAEEMLKAEELSELDTLFCLQLLGQEHPVGLPALAAYVRRRDKKKLKELSNLTLYKELARILKEVCLRERTETGSMKKRWKIMVD